MNKKILGLSIASVLLLIFFVETYYVVHPGEEAIALRMGKIVKHADQAGVYIKIPLVDEVVYFNTRINKSVIETTALTKDLQFVSIGIALNYRILDAKNLYHHIGYQYEERIIDPFAQETIKAIVAKFTAENLIQYRHEAKELVFNELKDRLAPLYIALVDFNFVHLDFSKDFIKAVEEKQIAVQKSITAKNYTEKINEESLQSMKRSDAEAYALKVKREAITPELIELKKIEKWDGKLPLYMGSSTPIIDINKG